MTCLELHCVFQWAGIKSSYCVCCCTPSVC